jgi:hypothetical protein
MGERGGLRIGDTRGSGTNREWPSAATEALLREGPITRHPLVPLSRTLCWASMGRRTVCHSLRGHSESWE